MGCLAAILLFMLGIIVSDNRDGGCGCLIVILLFFILFGSI